MQAWRITQRARALDRQGTGARLTGGRWNPPGRAAAYAGLTPEIAALEKLVHTSELLPRDLVLVRLELPDDAHLYRRHAVNDLPAGWDVLPGSTAAAAFGDEFLRGGMHLGLVVPSVVMPEACNVVLNPVHAAFGAVTFRIVRPFGFDPRLRPG